MKKEYRTSKTKKALSILLCGAIMTGLVGCGSISSVGTGAASDNSSNDGKVTSSLDPSNPTPITIWNYYNGDQQSAFDNLVSEFNDTVGTEEGIIVNSVSQGSIDNLADSLIAAADGTIGAQELPTMAAIYAETAFILNQKQLLVNLDDYVTKEEQDSYIPGFIEEGRLTKGGELLLFPISKSTECFAVNVTDWKNFEDATGISVESIDNYESLTDVAKQYYDWTDSLTPDVLEDGKALYGRDSVANYVYIGATQLGHEIFSVDESGMKMDMDKETFRTLWNNYYIPFINGYFASDSNHRSEDMKTGRILAMTGSTSGVSYIPVSVVDENDVSHDIEITIQKPLTFKDGQNIYVQQGAGYCILKGTNQEQYAAAEFLKWFTSSDRNLEFSVTSGYSAVTVDANDPQKIKDNFAGSGDSVKDQNILNALLISSEVYNQSETYTNKPFKGSKEVRDILANALSDCASADRAKVVEAIAEGKTKEEAVAEFSSDEYFNTWFDNLYSEVKKAVE